MQLATLRTAAGTNLATIEGTTVAVSALMDVGEALATGLPWSELPAPGAERLDVIACVWAPLVVAPAKVICLGHNYLGHIQESGAEVPEYPTLFAKFSRALIGATDDIHLPHVSSKVDWEAELAVVIGRSVRYADRDEAYEAIAGFTLMNDVSMRDWQSRTRQVLQGKTFEHSTPLGPTLVAPSDVDDARDLAIECFVNDELVQSARTSDLLFKPEDIVSYISSVITLEPGDVIATGTPSGVGVARTPPRYLRDGDVLRTRIEGLGELCNRAISEPRKDSSNS